MLAEIGQFFRNGKEISKLQKAHPRAEFADMMMDRTDQQGWAENRRALVGDLTGRVLEVGCGTGTMFGYYGPNVRVEAIEPEADFLALAMKKAAAYPDKINAQHGDGMSLVYEEGSFDAVVFGLVLCSVPSMERVLAEAYRVLRPGGRLRALEHVRSEHSVAGVLLDITNPIWMKINQQGCRWNRRSLEAIQAAGFSLDDVQSYKRFDTMMLAWPVRQVQAHKP
jgi:ubiquinone/menaquinone biosynthesis C-methylase UbiE